MKTIAEYGLLHADTKEIFRVRLWVHGLLGPMLTVGDLAPVTLSAQSLAEIADVNPYCAEMVEQIKSDLKVAGYEVVDL